jgi:DNA-binding NtrC family response regulator
VSALSDLPTLVTGETGTGKELVAHAYHALTGRRGPLIAVNCGAIPHGLVEATLFGHKKGGFSGAASDNLGLVRAAEGGTLFLDEIGDLPLPAQAALLRVLEAREVTPVGATQTIAVDIRVVCATHRDIPRMVAREEFRADLWARLAGFVLRLPPLRERLEDLGLFVAAAIARFAPPERAARLGLTRDASRELQRRAWPLNIRELMNVMARAIAASKGSDLIGVHHLPAPIAAVDGAAPAAQAGSLAIHAVPDTALEAAATVPAKAGGAHGGAAVVDIAEGADAGAADDDSADGADPADDELDLGPQLRSRRAQLWILLEEHRGNVSEIARVLGRQRRVVHRWLKALKLNADDFRR